MSIHGLDLESKNGNMGVIRTLIEQLAEEVKKLSRETRKVGTKRDSIELRRNIETGLIPNCNSMRDNIEGKDWETSSMDRIVEDSKLYNDFIMVKEELQRSEKKYRICISNNPLKSEHGSITKAVRGDPESSYLSIQVNDERTPLLQDEERREQEQLEDEQQQQQQQQLGQQKLSRELNANQDELDFHTIILRERSQQVTRIHSAVQEVNAIFHQLGSLVTQQGEQVDDIDSNIGQFSNNMQKANEQLRRADQNQRKKNRCGIMTLTIMIIIMLIVTLLVLS